MAVGGSLPDKLLGVRDGFLRYLREGLERPIPVAVVPHPQDEDATPLPVADREILELARKRAVELESGLSDRGYHFHVGTEAGLLVFAAGGEERHFVRSWTVLRGLGEEAWGSSGAVQLPTRLIAGLDGERIPFAIPGTRRRGGMVASLTGGLENRRSATALATFHALATLLYGRLEARPAPR